MPNPNSSFYIFRDLCVYTDGQEDGHGCPSVRPFLRKVLFLLQVVYKSEPAGSDTYVYLKAPMKINGKKTLKKYIFGVF